MFRLLKFSVEIAKQTINRNVAISATRHVEISSAIDCTKNDEPIEMPNPFEKEKVKCILCEMGVTPNYKNVRLLAQFQSPYTGRIYGRHITGLCKQKQEQVEKAITRAQHCALMPYYHKNVDYLEDPKLFNPEKPLRPHKY
ncbi:28S ribosomal protein S18c, mitochondrial [Condylostylus longicornis]|uniref:28S ribosomal protein S18c, mitochondrial n=1 Tax=Condylostylus longicornis TaxID=2530218 RepID=UPI00244DE28E|nr:28S ribosomal protein S18c, mitochondrial [Condylostylus longicornis]